MIARAWSQAKHVQGADIRRSENTEQALILCDITTKVLVKCRIAMYLDNHFCVTGNRTLTSPPDVCRGVCVYVR